MRTRHKVAAGMLVALVLFATQADAGGKRFNTYDYRSARPAQPQQNYTYSQQRRATGGLNVIEENVEQLYRSRQRYNNDPHYRWRYNDLYINDDIEAQRRIDNYIYGH